MLECIRQGQIGGGESHLLSLVEYLDKSVFEPVVLSFTDGPMVTRLRELGVKVHLIYTEKPFDITKWRRVKRLLEEEQVDIVHAHGTRANSNVLWAARSLKIPVVYTIHGWSFHADQPAMVRKLRIYGERYLTRNARVNISVSESNKQSGKQYISDFESVVINNGIDQRKFSPGRSFKNIRKELAIAEDKLLVLFLARFTHQKQPLTLIRSFLKALRAVPDMHLLLVGDGEEKEAAMQLVNETDAGSQVSFEPFRQDVPDLLAAADVFVLPSLWEGLSIGLLEAMAMAKAIIATDVDGTREVIQHRQNGLLVAPGDTDSLTDALVLLAENGSLRTEVQKQAQLTVQEKFSVSQMTNQIEQIYKSIFHGI